MPRLASVLFVTRKWPPAVGGMETYSVELTAALSRHVAIEVIPLAGRADGLPPSALSLVRFAFVTALRYLRLPRPPDIFHVGDLASWPLALVTWCRRERPSIFLSAHGTDVSYHRRGGVRGRLYGAYLRVGARLLRKARLISNSAATARSAAETGWQSGTVIPLATSISAQTPPLSHGRHLLFAGRLVERKGCRWFVEQVLPLLPQDINLHVAGTVWHEREQAVIGHPRVRHLGALSQRELIDEYRSALSVVVPNLELANGEFEGFGLVAAEAAAAGGLVLAAECGGLIEAVKEGETGFLIPPGDASAWRQKIEEIVEWAPERRSEFIGSAMANAKKRYCWKRVAEDVLEVYLEGRGWKGYRDV